MTTERLNNDQVAQRIIDSSSDLQRYLNLAPALNLTSPEPKTAYNSKTQIPLFPFPRLTIRP